MKILLTAVICIYARVILIDARPYQAQSNHSCANHLTMAVNGEVVPNGGKIQVQSGSQLNVICTESSGEGTHMYWIVGDNVSDTSLTRAASTDKTKTSYTIHTSFNATQNLHRKNLRCVADHSPSNCFETTKGIIEISD